MSEKHDPNKIELTISRNHSLALKKSDLARRGLELIDEAKTEHLEVVAEHEEKRIESIMLDCEIHYRMQGINMFATMEDFYKFADTEVWFHAKVDKVDFRKAKEAYISWAKKSHYAEYDKLSTGFFNKLLDKKETIGRQELMVRLEGVDFHAVEENIAYILLEIPQKAESKGNRHIATKELMNAADHYFRNPCLERAITLLEEYPSLLGLFELTKDQLYVKTRNHKKPEE